MPDESSSEEREVLAAALEDGAIPGEDPVRAWLRGGEQGFEAAKRFYSADPESLAGRLDVAERDSAASDARIAELRAEVDRLDELRRSTEDDEDRNAGSDAGRGAGDEPVQGEDGIGSGGPGVDRSRRASDRSRSSLVAEPSSAKERRRAVVSRAAEQVRRGIPVTRAASASTEEQADEMCVCGHPRRSHTGGAHDGLCGQCASFRAKRQEITEEPERCAMCGTTAELESGDCAFCAGRESISKITDEMVETAAKAFWEELKPRSVFSWDEITESGRAANRGYARVMLRAALLQESEKDA